MSQSENQPPASQSKSGTDRSRVRRVPERGTNDRAVIDAILDEGMVAHVGIVQDGQPFVIPMVYARDGDDLILHGSPASRLMKTLASGAPCCVTVTRLDGLVLARSTFHHSMNYRSVVVLGSVGIVEGDDAKLASLERLVEHVVPGRSADARGPSPQELKGTLVVRLSLAESTAKVRSGPPVDEEADRALPCWGGLIPIEEVFGGAEPDDLAQGSAVPDYVSGYRR